MVTAVQTEGVWAQAVTVVAAGGESLLRGVDFCATAGRVTAIVGPNGAGKSTLLSLLSRLRQPSSGQCGLHGRALPDWSVHELALARAVMLQETAVAFDFSVQEVVELGRYPHRQRPSPHEACIVAGALELFGVQDMAQRSMYSLSGGERARVQLARALAQIWEPLPDRPAPWLMLDEPTAALDLQHQHAVLGLVRQWARERGVGVLLVIHDLNLALRYADEVYVLQRGQRVAHGPTLQTLTPALVGSVWSVQAQAVTAACGAPQLLLGPPAHVSTQGLAAPVQPISGS